MTTDRYKAAGVDLNAAARAKQRIRTAVTSTQTPLTIGGFGAFGGMVRVPADVEQPALVMSTDGVGTKVLVAVRAGVHDTVGEDLLNHSVNDILVHGARPLAFLDYIAGAGMEIDTIAALVEGVARGCRAHEMALVGGETAQMPDVYHPGHYDLAGTIVGVVSEAAALHGDAVEPGDVLVGYASTGLHTNGYTLARQIVFEEMRLDIGDEMPDAGTTVGAALLAVHRSYWPAMRTVLDRIHALAHVTGGGIPGNLERPLPQGCGARVERSAWPVPPLFRVLQQAGGVDEAEMFHVFNMGIGMIAVVPRAAVDEVRGCADGSGVETWVIGEVVTGAGVELVD
ncbi:MAG: phosphoribosylformylglycinamidine cyclo-ligase [Gemmatimonadota bacterium]|nr:MAG: phosphoribosylformylglycinamidine cyclo-ligase [Gemmatimonadota bacterium]